MSTKPDIRAIIRQRLEELGENKLWLARQCDGDPKQAHIYAFLADASPGGMSVELLEKLLGLLGLTVAVADKNAKPPRRKMPKPPNMPV